MLEQGKCLGHSPKVSRPRVLEAAQLAWQALLQNRPPQHAHVERVGTPHTAQGSPGFFRFAAALNFCIASWYSLFSVGAFCLRAATSIPAHRLEPRFTNEPSNVASAEFDCCPRLRVRAMRAKLARGADGIASRGCRS